MRRLDAKVISPLLFLIVIALSSTFRDYNGSAELHQLYSNRRLSLRLRNFVDPKTAVQKQPSQQQQSPLEIGKLGRDILHIATGGPPRTATTLQHNIACVCLLLSLQHRRHAKDLIEKIKCTFLGNAISQTDFTPGVPHVIKSHKPVGDVDKGKTLIFSTSKTKNDALMKWNWLRLKGYNVGFIQDLQLLFDSNGIDVLLDQYKQSFNLNKNDAQLLTEYFQLWTILRTCCGKQMSNTYRNDLLPMNMKDPTYLSHPFCSSYDISEIETLLIETELYQRINNHKQLYVMNRPSTIDGPLDGTYCERYNKLVINEGVGFNQPFTWHGNE